MTAWQEVWLMIWMGFNCNHSAKARLLQLNCDFCVSIVAHFIILYFGGVQNRGGLERSAPFFFFAPHTSLALCQIKRSQSAFLIFCKAQRCKAWLILSAYHGKGERKKTKQPFASSLNTLVIRQPSIRQNRAGSVDMTLFFFFFTLSHLLPDIAGGRTDLKKIILFFVYKALKPSWVPYQKQTCHNV